VASTHLGTLHGAAETLTEQGTREDRPTGTTPRKRTWNYVDNWKLTKSRDEILRAWREQGKNISSETFLAEHLPLPGGDGDVDVKTEEAESPIELEHFSSTGGASLSSSDSSLSILKAARPLQPKKASGPDKGIPSLGTLTDSRNVYMTRGSRRAR